MLAHNNTSADESTVRIQVAYSQRVAKIVHSLPVAYVIALPLLTASAATQGLALRVLLKGATLTLTSLISAILCPALLGVLRVLALGERLTPNFTLIFNIESLSQIPDQATLYSGKTFQHSRGRVADNAESNRVSPILHHTLLANLFYR